MGSEVFIIWYIIDNDDDDDEGQIVVQAPDDEPGEDALYNIIAQLMFSIFYIKYHCSADVDDSHGEQESELPRSAPDGTSAKEGRSS